MTMVQSASQVFQAASNDVALTVDQLRDMLVQRTIDGNKGNIAVVEYTTDMLAKGKLLSGAATSFPNGCFRRVRKTININYDYGDKLERRTDGEQTAGKGNWQMAVLINGKISPLTTHKDDVESFDGQTVKVKVGGRAFLRYEPLTDAQKSAGFGQHDYSKYVDNKGKEIAPELVKPFMYDRPFQVVAHRTLSLGNVNKMKIDGLQYVIATVEIS